MGLSRILSLVEVVVSVLIVAPPLMPWVPPAQAEVIIEGLVDVPPENKSAVAATGDSARAAEPEMLAAVVYLEGAPSADTASQTHSLAQQGLQFMPRILPIRKGDMVEFPNNDDEYHNVFSYSKVKRFDLGRYKKGDSPAQQTFEGAGVVKVYCEIHRHMRATILVLDTPYYTKTDPSGKYKLTLPNVPAGRYKLKAWLDEKNVREKDVQVPSAGALRVDFPAG